MAAPPRIGTVLTPARAVVAAALVAAVVAVSISGTIPFDSDEANHANLALRQFQDLADGRLLDFLRHSYRTGQFPFLHGWTVVPFFAVLGTTAYAARVAQCLHFVVGAAATTWAAWRACGDDRRAGALAGVLFALSPLLAVTSGLCMLETPGAATTALSLACLAEALRSRGRRGAWFDVATAGAVLATWFTKLNFGIWILPAIGLGYLVAAWGRKDAEGWNGVRAGLGRCLRWFVVVALVLGLWYSTADARAQFHGFLTNPSQAVSVVEDVPTFHLPGLSLSNFRAYFPMVAGDFHVHWTVGAAVMLLAAFGAWRGVRGRNGAVVAAAACLAFTWATLSTSVREYALARFIASAMPALWVCAAAGAAPLLARTGDGLVARIAERVLLLAGLAACVVQVRHGLTPEGEYEIDDRMRPVFAYLVESLPPPANVMVVNYTDHTSARTLAWELGSRRGSRARDFDVKTLIGERIYESDKGFDAWLDAPRSWGDATWGGYVVEMEPGPDYVDAKALVPETVAMWHAAIARRAPGRLEVASRKAFPDLGLTVVVWRDLAPPPSPPARPPARDGR